MKQRHRRGVTFGFGAIGLAAVPASAVADPGHGLSSSLTHSIEHALAGPTPLLIAALLGLLAVSLSISHRR